MLQLPCHPPRAKCLFGGMVGLCLLVLPLPMLLAQKHTQHLPSIASPTSNTKYKPSDVMATIDGENITRFELTNFWIQMDAQASNALGRLLVGRWQAVQGKASSYTFSESEIYQQLYGETTLSYANSLSNLVTKRLVAKRAVAQGILVSLADAKARAHELFDDVRQRQNSKQTDDELIKLFRIPRVVFLEDMRFVVQAEKLLAADIARKNGHPLGPQDWIVLRSLFAEAKAAPTQEERDKQLAEAKQRLEAWDKEIANGKSFEEVARAHNEDLTKESGGLRGASLRGTGTKSLEDVILALKPGERSLPQRATNGWYIFQVERRGNQITEEERKQGWKKVVEAKLQPFLAELRKAAKITSVVPLPQVDTTK